MAFLDGYKTIVAGVGLIALGIYQLTQGQTEQGITTIAQGLAALGIRRAITTSGGLR